jgi:hypothetical protein
LHTLQEGQNEKQCSNRYQGVCEYFTYNPTAKTCQCCEDGS